LNERLERRRLSGRYLSLRNLLESPYPKVFCKLGKVVRAVKINKKFLHNILSPSIGASVTAVRSIASIEKLIECDSTRYDLAKLWGEHATLRGALFFNKDPLRTDFVVMSTRREQRRPSWQII